MSECREHLLAQPAFVDGAFHTTYLDELLQSRNGRPFVEPTPALEEMAAAAAAIEAALSASSVGNARSRASNSITSVPRRA